MLMVAFLVILQRIFVPQVFHVHIHVLMMLVLVLVLVEPLAVVMRWAFYGGIFYDVLSSSLLGTHAFVLLVAAWLVYVLLARVTSENWLLPIIAVLVGGTIYYVLLGLLMYVAVGPFEVRDYLVSIVAPAMIVVLVPALPVFLLARWWRSIRRGEVPIDVY